MISAVRIVLAAAVCLAVAGLIVLGRSWTARQAERPNPLDTALDQNDCRECHPAVWQEWESSLHASAFSSPEVQAAFEHFGFDRKCMSCHAPEPVWVTGLGEPVELRPAGRQTGVDCLSCHLLPGGGVAARRTIPGAACNPVESPGLSTAAVCEACHDAIYDDWKESRYATEDQTCQACHMPPYAERNGGTSHRCLGGHDPDTVRSGATMECRLDGGELVVAVTNRATGHNFPGERHSRVLLIEVIARNAADGIVLARQELIKDVTPFRGETTADEIRVDNTFEARFPAAGCSTADVKLLYKLFRWQSDADALVVHHETFNLDQQ